MCTARPTRDPRPRVRREGWHHGVCASSPARAPPPSMADYDCTSARPRVTTPRVIATPTTTSASGRVARRRHGAARARADADRVAAEGPLHVCGRARLGRARLVGDRPRRLRRRRRRRRAARRALHAAAAQGIVGGRGGGAAIVAHAGRGGAGVARARVRVERGQGARSEGGAPAAFKHAPSKEPPHFWHLSEWI